MGGRGRKIKKTLFQGVIRDLKTSDLVSVGAILETWVRDRDTGELLLEEVQRYLDLMRDSLVDESVAYLVAEASLGKVVGVLGMRSPKKELLSFTKTLRPVEFINAYVDKKYRGSGVGTALFIQLEENAKEQGFTEIIVDSGPRYEKTGWGFADRVFGKPIGIMKNYYPKGDAIVWGKILTS